MENTFKQDVGTKNAPFFSVYLKVKGGTTTSYIQTAKPHT